MQCANKQLLELNFYYLKIFLGNVIEWSYPKSLEASKFLAFKALPSGAHKVDSDFM